MSSSRPAAGGGRWVDVAPARLERWLAGFAERHGPVEVEGLVHRGADGAVAELVPPYRPLTDELTPRLRVGVLLVRLGGYAAGVFETDETGARLVSSKVGSRQVHGRSAAGGQSQQRFARRRDNQVTVAYATAADNAVRVLGDERLDAVVTGGERTAVDAVLADRRLERLRPLVVDRLVDVPDPRLVVLEASPALWSAVSIRVTP
jgi:peptide subunit release factor 1 (eRF1)